MVRYSHRQTGTFILSMVGLGVLAVILLLYFVEPHPIGIAVLILLVLCLLLFPSLTVDVTDADILLRFGFGLVRRRFPLDSILEAKRVRSPWYLGWGIRIIRKGLLFNVSGFDAVELTMKNGRVYRIGTDRPADLTAAIIEALDHKR